MKRYLTTKIAEEAAEVAQAACKHLIHGDASTLADLEGEVADLLALVSIARRSGQLDTQRVGELTEQRRAREKKRGRCT